MKYKAIINNEYIDSANKVNIINPANEEIVGSVPALDSKQIKLAYQSSEAAFQNWKKTIITKRVELLEKFGDLLIKHQDELANIMVSEVGKNKKDSLTEIVRTVDYIKYTNQEALRIQANFYSGESMGIVKKWGIFTREPLGIVLCIGPFNYPVNLTLSKMSPALVMGNTVVLKGATQGSLTACFLGHLFRKAGFPPGVVNVVTGKGRDITKALVNDTPARMVIFTGGSSTGKQISRDLAMSKVVLELGGKDVAIVCDDANLEKAASEIVKGAFGFSGQRCTAIKRVFVSDKVGDILVAKIAKKIEKLKIGNPLDNPDIVPVVSKSSADYIEQLIKESIAKKATIVTGNKRKNNLIWPTLIDHVTSEMKIAWEEPFGPVLPVLRINDLDQAIKLQNQSSYGLQGSVFTSDFNKFMCIAEKLDTGSVNWNRSSSRGPDSFPFIGVKDSGLGEQGIRDSLLSLTRPKGYVLNWE